MRRNEKGMNRCILDLTGNGNPKDFLRLQDDFMTNILITGATGSGKTTSSYAAMNLGLLNTRGIKPQDRCGFVVCSYKSSDIGMWEEWCYRQKRESDVIKISAGDKDVFNLLEFYRNAPPANVTSALMNLSSLTLDSGGGRQKGEIFWEVKQRESLDRYIRLNRISSDTLSIANLYRLHVSMPNSSDQLDSEEFCEQSYYWKMLQRAVENVGERHPEFIKVEDHLREKIHLAERTRSSIDAMVSSAIEPFVSSTILNDLFCGESRLDVNDIFSGKILLLDLSVQKWEHLGRLSQVLFSYVLRKAIEQRDLMKHPNPVIFATDECQVFIDKFTHAFSSTCRSSRAANIYCTQNISNLYAALGGGKEAETKVNALTALCNTKVMHSQNDPVSQEINSKVIGKDYIDLNSVNVSRGYDSSAGSSQSLQYLFQPREFSMLRTGGETHNYISDAIIAGTGRRFSNDMNAMKASFKQYFA